MIYKNVKKYAKAGNPSLVMTGRIPATRIQCNTMAWERMTNAFDLTPKLTLTDLTNVVGHYFNPAKPTKSARDFVNYCTDLGWLKVVA